MCNRVRYCLHTSWKRKESQSWRTNRLRHLTQKRAHHSGHLGSSSSGLSSLLRPFAFFVFNNRSALVCVSHLYSPVFVSICLFLNIQCVIFESYLLVSPVDLVIRMAWPQVPRVTVSGPFAWQPMVPCSTDRVFQSLLRSVHIIHSPLQL